MPEISEQIEELRRWNALLQMENEMFESFLSQMDFLDMDSQAESQTEESEALNLEPEPESAETSPEQTNVLKVEVKYYIAVCELEELRKDPYSTHSTPVHHIKYYKASLDDSVKRLAEIKRERRDFEEFVAETQQNTQIRSQRAHKVIAYVERDLKAKKALIERIRRRNGYLRVQSTKQRQHLANQKEQTHETVSPVNLEHLKQKNAQSEELLQKSQEQLQGQRVLLRKTQQNLNYYKERLKKEIQESESLSKKIDAHEEKLSKIREKQEKVEKERAQAEDLNMKLKARLANFRVPDVMKYIEAKTTNDHLRQTVKTLERKARIDTMESKMKKAIAGDRQVGVSSMPSNTPRPINHRRAADQMRARLKTMH